MNPATDPTDTAEAKAMLDQFPELYFSILKNTRIEQEPGKEALCSFEVPVLGKRIMTAPTALQAVRAALLELTDVLSKTPPHEWPSGWRRTASSLSAAAQSAPSLADSKPERFQAKARQLTIGITMPTSLKTSLQHIAKQQQVSFAELARQLARDGFEDFDERSYSEASEELFAILSSEVRRWEPSITEQVMIRVDPGLATRMRSAAKEYRRSASEFGVLCLAHGFVLRLQLVEVEQKVAACRGPAARKLAPQIGLGKQVALLSGVLAGTICAPKKVLEYLSESFETPQRVLAAFFKQSFDARVIPAFKAENGKPQIVRLPTSWEQAVKSLRLPAEQTSQLLELDK